MLNFSYEPVGQNADIMCLAIEGDLTTENYQDLLRCVESQVEDGYQQLILNCDHLGYISSMGLGMLVRVNSRMKRIGGEVKLACLHGTAARILKMVRFDRIFQLYPSVEDAAMAFGDV